MGMLTKTAQMEFIRKSRLGLHPQLFGANQALAGYVLLPKTSRRATDRGTNTMATNKPSFLGIIKKESGVAGVFLLWASVTQFCTTMTASTVPKVQTSPANGPWACLPIDLQMWWTTAKLRPSGDAISLITMT